MNEHLMGRDSSDKAESWRMLADLQDRNAEQGDPAVPAETAEDMLADPQSRVNAKKCRTRRFRSASRKR